MLVFYLDKSHGLLHNSAPTKQLKVPVSTPTAQSELLLENGTTLSRHDVIASFSDICTYSMSDVGGRER